ncbi:response regulator [Candidatus Omnitrophota bacterium]
MEKWNRRYPSELPVDLQLKDIPGAIEIAKRAVDRIEDKPPAAYSPIVRNPQLEQELGILDSLMKNPAFLETMAGALLSAYNEHANTDYRITQDTDATVFTKEDLDRTQNLAGLIGVEVGTSALLATTRKGNSLVSVLKAITEDMLTEKEMRLLALFANATWKAGVPFRVKTGSDGESLGPYSLMQSHPDFVPVVLAREEVAEEDILQMKVAAHKLLSAIQHIDDPQEQLDRLEFLLKNKGFLELLARESLQAYNSRHGTKHSISTDQTLTGLTKRDLDIAMNLLGFIALEVGVGALLELTRQGQSMSDVLNAIVEGRLTGEEETLLALFANATWKAGVPFRVKTGSDGRSLGPYFRIMEHPDFRRWAQLPVDEQLKDLIQVHAAAAQLLLSAIEEHKQDDHLSASTPAEDKKPPADPAGRLSGARILVVDDDKVDRMAAKRTLELEGAKVVTANNPQAALAAFQSKDPFDVVITDNDMGKGIDGLILANQIRSLSNQQVPVVMMTGSVESAQKGLAEGSIGELIDKGFDSDKLARALVEAVARLTKEQKPAAPSPGAASQMAQDKELASSIIDYLNGDSDNAPKTVSDGENIYTLSAQPTEIHTDKIYRLGVRVALRRESDQALGYFLRFSIKEGTIRRLDVTLGNVRFAGSSEEADLTGEGLGHQVFKILGRIIPQGTGIDLYITNKKTKSQLAEGYYFDAAGQVKKQVSKNEKRADDPQVTDKDMPAVIRDTLWGDILHGAKFGDFQLTIRNRKKEAPNDEEEIIAKDLDALKWMISNPQGAVGRLVYISAVKKGAAAPADSSPATTIDELLNRKDKTITFSTSPDPSRAYTIHVQKDFVDPDILFSVDDTPQYMLYVNQVNNEEEESEYPVGFVSGIKMAKDKIMNLGWVIILDYPGILKELERFHKERVIKPTPLLDLMGIHVVFGPHSEYSSQIKFLYGYLTNRSSLKTDEEIREFFRKAPQDYRNQLIGPAVIEFCNSFVPVGAKIRIALAHRKSLELLRSGVAFEDTSLGRWFKRSGYGVVRVEEQPDKLPICILVKKRLVHLRANWHNPKVLGRHYSAKSASSLNPSPAEDKKPPAAEASEASEVPSADRRSAEMRGPSSATAASAPRAASTSIQPAQEESMFTGIEVREYVRPPKHGLVEGKRKLVGQNKGVFNEGRIETPGVANCVALIIINEDTGEQFVAHLDASSRLSHAEGLPDKLLSWKSKKAVLTGGMQNMGSDDIVKHALGFLTKIISIPTNNIYGYKLLIDDYEPFDIASIPVLLENGKYDVYLTTDTKITSLEAYHVIKEGLENAGRRLEVVGGVSSSAAAEPPVPSAAPGEANAAAPAAESPLPLRRSVGAARPEHYLPSAHEYWQEAEETLAKADLGEKDIADALELLETVISYCYSIAHAQPPKEILIKTTELLIKANRRYAKLVLEHPELFEPEAGLKPMEKDQAQKLMDDFLEAQGEEADSIYRPKYIDDESQEQVAAVLDLTSLPEDTEYILVGDLHSRLGNLIKILNTNDNFQKLKDGRAVLIILGDAVHPEPAPEEVEAFINLLAENPEDDEWKALVGEFLKVIMEDKSMDPSVATMQFIMRLKTMLPFNVFYILGNHDYLTDNVVKGGVKQGIQYKKRLGELYGRLYAEDDYQAFINDSPIAVVGDGFVATHAAPPPMIVGRVKGKLRDPTIIDHIYAAEAGNEDDPITVGLIDGRIEFSEVSGKLQEIYLTTPEKDTGYTLEDVGTFLETMGQPGGTMFVGHGALADGGWHWDFSGKDVKHHMIYAARDRVGYASVKAGKVEFIEASGASAQIETAPQPSASAETPAQAAKVNGIIASNEKTGRYIVAKLQEMEAFVEGEQQDAQALAERQAKLAEMIENHQAYRFGDSRVPFIPIKGLLKNTGQFAHIGLGNAYGEPVVYIDADYAYIGPEHHVDYADLEFKIQVWGPEQYVEGIQVAYRKIIHRHELEEIRLWEEEIRVSESGTRVNPYLQGISSLSDVRNWMRDHINDAIWLTEYLHNQANNIANVGAIYRQGNKREYKWGIRQLAWSSLKETPSIAASPSPAETKPPAADPTEPDRIKRVSDLLASARTSRPEPEEIVGLTEKEILEGLRQSRFFGDNSEIAITAILNSLTMRELSSLIGQQYIPLVVTEMLKILPRYDKVLIAGRDGELFYDALKTVLQGMPQENKVVLFPGSFALMESLASREANADARRFLAQFGITEEVILGGGKILVFDTGFSGSVGGILRTTVFRLFGSGEGLESKLIATQKNNVRAAEITGFATEADALYRQFPKTLPFIIQEGYPWRTSYQTPANFVVASALQLLPHYHGHYRLGRDAAGNLIAIPERAAITEDIDGIYKKLGVNASVVNPAAAMLVQRRVIEYFKQRRQEVLAAAGLVAPALPVTTLAAPPAAAAAPAAEDVPSTLARAIAQLHESPIGENFTIGGKPADADYIIRVEENHGVLYDTRIVLRRRADNRTMVYLEISTQDGTNVKMGWIKTPDAQDRRKGMASLLLAKLREVFPDGRYLETEIAEEETLRGVRKNTRFTFAITPLFGLFRGAGWEAVEVYYVDRNGNHRPDIQKAMEEDLREFRRAGGRGLDDRAYGRVWLKVRPKGQEDEFDPSLDDREIDDDADAAAAPRAADAKKEYSSIRERRTAYLTAARNIYYSIHPALVRSIEEKGYDFADMVATLYPDYSSDSDGFIFPSRVRANYPKLDDNDRRGLKDIMQNKLGSDAEQEEFAMQQLGRAYAIWLIEKSGLDPNHWKRVLSGNKNPNYTPEFQRPFFDLGAGTNPIFCLQNLLSVRSYFFVDSSPFVRTFLDEAINILGLDRNKVQAIQADITKPEIFESYLKEGSVGTLRISNIGPYLQDQEMPEGWYDRIIKCIAPGGQLIIETLALREPLIDTNLLILREFEKRTGTGWTQEFGHYDERDGEFIRGQDGSHATRPYSAYVFTRSSDKNAPAPAAEPAPQNLFTVAEILGTMQRDSQWRFARDYHRLDLYSKAFVSFQYKARDLITAGQESVVIELENGNILKISALDFFGKRDFNSDFDAACLESGKFTVKEGQDNIDIYYIIQPKLEMTATLADAWRFMESLPSGYRMGDIPKASNIGFDPVKKRWFLVDTFAVEGSASGKDKDDNDPPAGSSAMPTSTRDPTDQGPGGIDFRALAITIQPMTAIQGQPALGTVPFGDSPLSGEWLQIQQMVDRGIMPSVERIKDELKARCEDDNFDKNVLAALSCIASILRLEEDNCCSTNASLRGLLVLLESGRSAGELKLALDNQI